MVEFINLIFKLSVLLAIFIFIWGLIRFGFMLLRGGMPMSYPLEISLKVIQYLIIVSIAILFCTDNPNGNLTSTITTGLLLFMYFIGKVQRNQFKAMMRIQIQGQLFSNERKPDMRVEFSVVALAMLVFMFFIWKPDLAQNAISNWFYVNITDIADTPIFGFIFKIVGFFMTISILMRMFQAIGFILSGQAFAKKKNNATSDDDSHYDDFEEIK